MRGQSTLTDEERSRLQELRRELQAQNTAVIGLNERRADLEYERDACIRRCRELAQEIRAIEREAASRIETRVG